MRWHGFSPQFRDGWGVLFPNTTEPVSDPRRGRTVGDLKLTTAAALPHGGGLCGQSKDFPNPQHARDRLVVFA